MKVIYVYVVYVEMFGRGYTETWSWMCGRGGGSGWLRWSSLVVGMLMAHACISHVGHQILDYAVVPRTTILTHT
jgi:hypothetical protein